MAINKMIKIGITGQQGFVGKHLYKELEKHSNEFILLEFQRGFFQNKSKLDAYVDKCDVIIHLAAMNRHKSQQVIYDTNMNLVQKLLKSLEATNSKTHVIFSSSTQENRDNLYGNSKKEGRELLRAWAKKTGNIFTPLIIPNVFGPYGKPFYNSFISTFCHQIQQGESPQIINDSKVNLIYIKDLVYEIIEVIKSPEDNNKIKEIPSTFSIKVSKILQKLKMIKSAPNSIENTKINLYLKETLNSFKQKNNKNKIMILGASGMAGHVIYKYLEKKGEFIIKNISFRQKVTDATIILDVRNFKVLEKEIEKFNPDIIINAIGILISGSNENPSNSILLNSYFPHFLSSLSDIYNYKIIHLSTDCVFSGKDEGGYVESSFRDADDIYGRSKALGEINTKDHLTIRTSIIGPEFKINGQGLLHWFLKQEEEVTGFSSAFWSGITTLQLAKVIYDIIVSSNISGIHHITNNTKISKYDLLVLFKEVWNKATIIKKGEGKSVDKSFIDTMNVAKIPSYKEMLLDMKDFMTAYDKDFNYKKNYKL
jgi:dTDP-4-dehydrorhamnose reductase